MSLRFLCFVLPCVALSAGAATLSVSGVLSSNKYSGSAPATGIPASSLSISGSITVDSSGTPQSWDITVPAIAGLPGFEFTQSNSNTLFTAAGNYQTICSVSVASYTFYTFGSSALILYFDPGPSGRLNPAGLSLRTAIPCSGGGTLYSAYVWQQSTQVPILIGNSGSSPGTPSTLPTINQNGVVPIYGTFPLVQPGSWASIFGNYLATGTATWDGNFPTSLNDTSVTIDGKSAYLWYVSPGQINLQVPDDANPGPVAVVVTTPQGTATSTVTLGPFAPSLCVLDGIHVTGIITRADNSGAYGGGRYDIIGPTGNSLGYKTVAAKAGDNITLFGVGFGPTNPMVAAGKAFADSAPTTNTVQFVINGMTITPTYSGMTSAGLYQFNLPPLPTGLGVGDVTIYATVSDQRSQAGTLISLDAVNPAVPKINAVTLASLVAGSGVSVAGTVVLAGPAPSGGATVALSSSGGLSVPGSITIPAGSTSATFTVSTQVVTTAQTAIVTATYAGLSVQTALTVTPATADSPFVQLTVVPAFQPAGFPSISTATFTVTPDPGNTTFTACIDGCDSGTVLLNGTAGNQGQTFNFSAVRPGRNSVLFSGSSTGLLTVTNASLTFNLAKTTASGKIVLGNVSGMLSLSGNTPQNPAITLSGPITGTYSEMLP